MNQKMIEIKYHPRLLKGKKEIPSGWNAERIPKGWQIRGSSDLIDKISKISPKTVVRTAQSAKKEKKKPTPSTKPKIKSKSIEKPHSQDKKPVSVSKIVSINPKTVQLTSNPRVRTVTKPRTNVLPQEKPLEELNKKPFSELSTEDRYALYKLTLGKEAVYHGRITNIYRSWKAQKLVDEGNHEKEIANHDQAIQNIEDKNDIIIGEIDTLSQNIHKCEISAQSGEKLELASIKNIHMVFDTVQTLFKDFSIPPNISENDRKSILESRNNITRKIKNVNQKITILDNHLKQQQNRTHALQGNPANLINYIEKMEITLGIPKSDLSIDNRLKIIQQKIDEVKSLRSQIEQ